MPHSLSLQPLLGLTLQPPHQPLNVPLALSGSACYAEEVKGGDGMEIYTLKQAARHAKIGIETLKRACEEGLIKASQLPNREWRIAESALEEALHKGIVTAQGSG